MQPLLDPACFQCNQPIASGQTCVDFPECRPLNWAEGEIKPAEEKRDYIDGDIWAPEANPLYWKHLGMELQAVAAEHVAHQEVMQAAYERVPMLRGEEAQTLLAEMILMCQKADQLAARAHEIEALFNTPDERWFS